MNLNEIYGKLDNYDGKLGALYSKEETRFILWAPLAKDVKLALYNRDGLDFESNIQKTVPMRFEEDDGIWQVTIKGDLSGIYYNYLVTNDDVESEVVDPYAKAVGVNGKRSMVINLEATNPEGWKNDVKPALKDSTDAVLYEMHVRDFSINQNSGVKDKYKGKYSGVAERNTRIPGTDVKTGLDYLMSLGITHVHLLPIEDYMTVDESEPAKKQFNWGYDPQNYNVPEGSYSLDPFKAEKRIKEVKEMVLKLHESGIRVVMDVVYNHTYKTKDSNLNLAVPFYYYRQNQDGSFSDGSGCGNEIASERKMVRKFIVDSVVYWAKEYHIDGFRFDLMALLDIDTLKEVRSELDKIDKSIILYGEGWNGGSSTLPYDYGCFKSNTTKFENMQIASFSDDIRDGIKGHVFNKYEKGFISGKENLEDTVKFAVTASVQHEDIDYSNVIYSSGPWANEPYQTINYASAHDNNTLFDKLLLTNEGKTLEEIAKLNKLSAAIILTCQGIPFFQAGEEFMRTKKDENGNIVENSYNSPDCVNSLDWERMNENKDMVDYYKGLIKLRKAHKLFHMNSADDIRKNLVFLKKGTNFENNNVVAYIINNFNIDDIYNKVLVIYNANEFGIKVNVEEADWSLIVNGDKSGCEELVHIDSNEIKVPAHCCYVLSK